MADTVDSETRSRMMSRIRSVDTEPELIVRRLLHGNGFRYRLHVCALPGRPDIVLPRYRAVIFVNGCFWHGHDCHLFRMPATQTEFWSGKISANRTRDRKNLDALHNAGWRTLTVWECALRGTGRISHKKLLRDMSGWLHSKSADHKIREAEYGE